MSSPSRSGWLVCVAVVTACVTRPDDGDTGDDASSSAASTEMSTMASTSATTMAESDGSTSDSAACIAAVEEADAFVMLYGSCQNDEDCTTFNGFCYPLATCGGVAVNVGADEAEWDALHSELEAECGPCGADPCGACVVCRIGTCSLTLECDGTSSG